MNLVEEETLVQSELQEAVRKPKRKTKSRSDVRKTIRILQEVPLVLSLVMFANMLADIIGYDISMYLYPLFGFSLYLSLRLFNAACAVYVSSWSKILYVQQIAVSIIEFSDNVFDLSLKLVHLQQVINTVIIASILSSFITYLYGKFKNSYQ